MVANSHVLRGQVVACVRETTAVMAPPQCRSRPWRHRRSTRHDAIELLVEEASAVGATSHFEHRMLTQRTPMGEGDEVARIRSVYRGYQHDDAKWAKWSAANP